MINILQIPYCKFQKNHFHCIKMKVVFWSRRQDSNLRHLAPKASALPNCATPRCYLVVCFFIVGGFLLALPKASLLLRYPKFVARSSLRQISTATPPSPRFIVHRTRFGDDATKLRHASMLYNYLRRFGIISQTPFFVNCLLTSSCFLH